MNCCACGNTGFTGFRKVNSFEVNRCRECGLGVTTPFPKPGDLNVINEMTYTLEQRIDAYRSRQHYFEKRYGRQLADIQKFRGGDRLLDIGCNIGMFLTEAAKAGYAVTGVELNRDCADYARNNSGHEVFSDYLENISFPAESFDVVTMYDVLEHIADLNGVLAEIMRILKDDGVLVVQAPNLDSVMSSVCGSSWSWLSPPDHIYHFTPSSLVRLLEQSGFMILSLKTWEPADDFCADVLQAKLGSSLVARGVRKLIRISGIMKLAVRLMQPFWWRQNRGALVEVYAAKSSHTGGRF